MSVEDSGGGGGGSDGVRPAIIDGLLCCILRAMSRSGASADLASEIERTASESEVKASWIKLFTHFNDAMDTTRKKKIIDKLGLSWAKLSSNWNLNLVYLNQDLLQLIYSIEICLKMVEI